MKQIEAAAKEAGRKRSETVPQGYYPGFEDGAEWQQEQHRKQV